MSMESNFFDPEMEELYNLYNETPIKATIGQLSVIEMLLPTSCMDEETKRTISQIMELFTYQEAEQILNDLRNSQVNRVHAGLNYNMGYLNEFMKRSI